MKHKVVFIMGTAHSGSTLLDLMLGSHPDAFSLGELCQLQRAYKLDKLRYLLPFYRNKSRQSTMSDAKSLGELQNRICAVCEGHCPFWGGNVNLNLLALSLAKGKRKRKHIIPEQLIRRFIRRIFNPYKFLFSKTKKHILIDSSKSVDWVSYQLSSGEFKSKSIEEYLLYMVRDGRAVVNSILRKYPHKTVAEITPNWVNQVNRMNKFFNEFDADEKMMVRYEELATNTIPTLKNICSLLEIEFSSTMVEYWKHEHHPLGGNIGVRSLIWRARNWQTRRFDRLRQINDDYYDKLGLSIKLDLRWKNELSRDQVEKFECIVGSLNAPFRYEPKSSRDKMN